MTFAFTNVFAEDEKKLIKESFDLMDSDNDGYLDYHETKSALKALGIMVKKSYVLTIIRIYDKRGGNRICFEDFYYIVSEKLNKQSTLNKVKYAFKLLTNNCMNKKITLKDLQGLNEKYKCNLTMEEMMLMIEEFDLDQDGSSTLL